MAQPYLGEIRMFAGNFAPAGWMLCEGQLVSKAQNQQLFTLIGTTYGGNGETNFALPDLRGRIPIHQGAGHARGESGGVETVTISATQMAAHNHALMGTNLPASDANPTGRLLAQASTFDPYQTSPANAPMATQSLTATGGAAPHDNVQPFLCINFIIAMTGIVPV